MVATTDQVLLTYGEAANLLAVSERTLATLVRTGQIKAVRFGRAVRFRREELEKFARRNEQK
jgi:excisionase family DNA binding protein